LHFSFKCYLLLFFFLFCFFRSLFHFLSNQLSSWFVTGQLTEEGGQLGDQGGDEQRVPELTDHGHQGVGGPSAEPQHHVGDSHLNNNPFYTAVLGATGILAGFGFP
jgi:hypothetical protein